MYHDGCKDHLSCDRRLFCSWIRLVVISNFNIYSSCVSVDQLIFDRCIDQVKSSQYMELAHSLEIDKAIGYLREKDFQQVGYVTAEYNFTNQRYQALYVFILGGRNSEVIREERHESCQYCRHQPLVLVQPGELSLWREIFRRCKNVRCCS